MKVYDAWFELQEWLKSIASQDVEHPYISPSAAADTVNKMDELEMKWE